MREACYSPAMRPPSPLSIVALSSPLACVSAGAGGLGVATPAAAQVIALTKEQAAALAAYDKALREFKAILAQRRAQIDAKKKLPNLPGQAVYLARLKVMSTYKDLTDALPSRIGRPNKFGVPPAYFDADIEPLIEEYAALFKIMQAPPAGAQASETPFKDVADLGPGDRARQGPRCGDRRRGGPHQPRAVLCRDERQPEHRQCALQQVQGQPADGRRGRSQGAQGVGGAQAEDRGARSCGGRARRQGDGARRQGRPAVQSLDRGAQRADERATPTCSRRSRRS